MQITRITQNYNNHNQNTSFKGEAERRIFQKAIKTAELKNLLKLPVNDETRGKVAEYFQKKFNHLKKTYSKHNIIAEAKNTNSNTSVFKFKQNKEKVLITLVNNDESLGLSYAERTPISKDTYKNELLNYIYIDDRKPVHTFLKDVQIGVYQLPKKNKPTTSYNTHASQYIDNFFSPKRFEHNSIFQNTTELDLQKMTRIPIPRKKK